MLHRASLKIWYLPILFIITSSLLCLRNGMSFRNELHTKKKKSHTNFAQRIVALGGGREEGDNTTTKTHTTFQIQINVNHYQINLLSPQTSRGNYPASRQQTCISSGYSFPKAKLCH